jgi:hypothetical protein
LSIKITQLKGFFRCLLNFDEKHKMMNKKSVDTPLLVIYDERHHWEGGDQKTHMKKDYSEVAEA